MRDRGSGIRRGGWRWGAGHDTQECGAGEGSIGRGVGGLGPKSLWPDTIFPIVSFVFSHDGHFGLGGGSRGGYLPSSYGAQPF